MKNRDIHQRRAYAQRRLSLAIDRFILATQPADLDRARRWAYAWGKRAGLLSAQREEK